MRWKKLGKIFDPVEHQIPNNCVEFSQAPQSLVLQDRVRIYYSTREKDASGKYLSHVAYVDFSRDMKDIIGTSQHTVIPLGKLGCFDEHGIFPFNVLKDGDRVLAYTTGCNRKSSVPVDAAIGLAISHDEGQTFSRIGLGGPIVAATLHEPFLVADAFVQRYGDTFYMWYIYGTKWLKFADSGQHERVYKIAQATSPDGLHWNRDGKHIIESKLDENECQALPTVIFHAGKYHMYFCYREAHGFRKESGRGYRLGYAYSLDLIHWVRDDTNAGIDLSDEGWDSEMQCYPHLFECDGKIYLIYNGNEFGRRGFGLAVLEN